MSYIGTTKVGSMYLGDTKIGKAYLGSDLVYEQGNGGPTIITFNNIVKGARNPGTGLEYDSSLNIRATINKRFDRSELVGATTITIPSGFYVAVVGLKTTAGSNSDFYNTGWLEQTTNSWSLPDAVWQYFAINFRRSDNGTVTSSDLNTLMAGTSITITNS